MRSLPSRWAALLTSMLFLALSIEALAGTTARRQGRVRKSGNMTAQTRQKLETFANVQQARSFLRTETTRISRALECNC
jgi:hypothetical protein